MSDWDRFNDQFRENDDERNERLAAARKKRAQDIASTPKRKPIPAQLHRYPGGCPDPDWCLGNAVCHWKCEGTEENCP